MPLWHPTHSIFEHRRWRWSGGGSSLERNRNPLLADNENDYGLSFTFFCIPIMRVSNKEKVQTEEKNRKDAMLDR